MKLPDLIPAMEKKLPMLSKIPAGLRIAGSLLMDLCLPRICAGCGQIGGQEDGFWCAECLGNISWIVSPICPQCGRPFPDAPHSPDHLCGECALETFHFTSARSVVLHAGIMRDRIHQFKFGGRLEWIPPFVELLRIAYDNWGIPVPEIVFPVPLHVKRLRERGFNQSGLLAKEFARSLDLSVSFDTLVRKNRTAPQTRLNREQRLTNVKDAFEVPEKKDIRGRRILILDDVYTTGTTLSECARVLKKKGASDVYALTVTRALPN
jgi:ComF family protein